MEEMALNMNGFAELNENELMEVDGGMMFGFTNSVLPHVNGFIANRLVWTNAKVVYDNFYKPNMFPNDCCYA